MKRLLLLVLVMCLNPSLGGQTAIFRCDFEEPNVPGAGAGRIVARGRSDKALLVERDEAGSSVRQFSIPVEKFKGQRLATLRAEVKADDVSEPPNSWNGVKVMLVLETHGRSVYPQIELSAGTFDWSQSSRTIRLPKDIDGARLVVGLEQVRGRAWFDNLQITVGRPARTGRRYETKFTGHDLSRLRGFMHGPRFRRQDIRDLALDYNANQIRWQLNWVPMKQAEDWAQDMDGFDRWLEGALAECDKALEACEEYGIKVLVDLHTPPGGRAEGGVCRMFRQKRYQDKLIEVWRKIAVRYRGRQVIYAYDLLNEPVEGAVAEGLLNWRDLATQVTRAIREIEPGKPVVFEPSPWGGPDGFDALTPLDLDRVIYSFHMYRPHNFTHQGVYNDRRGIAYPGMIDGQMWDIERLREEMLPAIEFQKEFNVQIYVGEFSVIRWAPGGSGYRYLRDVIDLFEEYGWDWSYHAFREWDGWSIEHGPERNDRNPTKVSTARKQLLLKWLAKNERP